MYLAPIDWVDGSHANFIKLWKEDGMNRWRWAYAGATCDEFKHAVKTRSGGTVNNYRCLKKDGKLLFDTNMVVGSAGDISIISAIKAITRQPCCDLGLPAWGMDRCLHENGDDDSEKNC